MTINIAIQYVNTALTVNDKSFEGEKFHGLLDSSGMWGKVLRFFPSPPSCIHGFHLYTTATSVSTKASHKFSLKLSLAYLYLEMDESIWLTHVCADFTLSRITMESQEEESYSSSESKMKQIANCFFVCFFCRLLPNFLAETL